jgi:hypothetical protein
MRSSEASSNFIFLMHPPAFSFILVLMLGAAARITIEFVLLVGGNQRILTRTKCFQTLIDQFI